MTSSASAKMIKAKREGYGTFLYLKVYVPYLIGNQERRERFEVIKGRFKQEIEQMKGIVQEIPDI